MTIKERKELENNGIFLNHWYQVEYKRQNTIYSSSFPDFDSAHEEYNKYEDANLKEIEVWQYNERQVVVNLLWNEYMKYFEVE